LAFGQFAKELPASVILSEAKNLSVKRLRLNQREILRRYHPGKTGTRRGPRFCAPQNDMLKWFGRNT